MITGTIDKQGIKTIHFPAEGNQRRTAYLGRDSGLMDYDMKVDGAWIRLKTEVLSPRQIKDIRIGNN